ncbi:malto-oligosyltrehalose synthase [Roseomonas gilardii subsp. gilardii]|uniref:malto-oligosyltrehalose synthase n=1 Tax=Roseomonas gilardii TaxID=257708 RepID=UPI001FF9AF4A|nr:malto-oligosyltrehalose synthase [Roseomonas gilardii]UPG74074.1 malto-oligosyltrehalose synthase [Roseomonas gilardii subsp. gilardii]
MGAPLALRQLLRHRLEPRRPDAEGQAPRPLPRWPLRHRAGIRRPRPAFRAGKRQDLRRVFRAPLPHRPRHLCDDPPRRRRRLAGGHRAGLRRHRPAGERGGHARRRRRGARRPRPLREGAGGPGADRRRPRRLRPEAARQPRPPAPAAGGAELPPRLVARRDRRDQLAPLLRRHQPGRPAPGSPRGLRGHPRADPEALCRRLDRRRARGPCGRPRRPARLLPQAAPPPARRRPPPPRHGAEGEPLLLVEKILAPHERLRQDWMVDGTTGYNFMDEVAGLLHDPAGEERLTRLWTDLTARSPRFEDEAREARRQILRENLASELNGTATALHRIAQTDLATRDFTLTAIRRALSEVLAHFPVYRTYVSMAGRNEEDERTLEWALAGARRTVRATERPLLELLDDWLGGEVPRSLPIAERRQRLRAAVRFQQLSAPVAAKSVEDTAFYRYGRLISRNEVGSEPGHLTESPGSFHAMCRERARHFPREMLATATHDHKRGEDNRIRLAVISERPEEWATALTRWTRLNNSLKREVDGTPAPDVVDELMLYQTLVGAWPLDLDPTDEQGVQDLIQRVAAWQEKALREGKRRSEWAVPNEAYEAACQDFLRNILAADRASHMREEIAGFALRLAPAGAVNGLAQTLIRCTSPGIPDLYQGTEFWDFSLVDPDNRRPVDFAARRAALEAGGTPADLLSHWKDGRAKQAVIARALALRARCPELFAEGDYLPLEVQGTKAAHLLAFARRRGGQAAITVVTRLPAALLGEVVQPLVPATSWEDTAILLPPDMPGALTDVLNAGEVAAPDGTLPASTLLARLPVALLSLG